MIARASGALFFAYSVVTIAGVLFLLFPSPMLAQIVEYRSTMVVWSLFYVIGGLTAAISIVLRSIVKNTIPLWHFEIAGMSLIVVANLVYAYALAQTAFELQEFNILATAIIILGFAAGFVARSVETLRLVKTLNRLADGRK